MISQKREIHIESCSFETSEDSICFRFELDAPGVLIGEVDVFRNRESFFHRVLIDRGWLSETLDMLVECSIDLNFSGDGRILEVRCRKFPNLSLKSVSKKMKSCRTNKKRKKRNG